MNAFGVRTGTALLLAVGIAGCDTKRSGEDDSAGGVASLSAGAAEGAGDESTGGGSTGTGDDAGVQPSDDDGGAASTDDGDDPPPPIKLDVHGIPDASDADVCGAPSPVVCDDQDDDPWHALGLNCDGGTQVDGSIDGDPTALSVYEGNLGTYVPAPYPPQEGSKFVIMSSGRAEDLTIPGYYASTSHPGHDPGATLPAPINVAAVSTTDDCVSDPTLVGTGDCSNTIEAQWYQGSGANDYAEMRMTVEVPAGTYGFSYNLAMFSTEYPNYYQSGYNDMYIAWLESEVWTGNISFDEMGHPISLNAGFLDYKDAPNTFDCPAPCQAPELAGTAMEGHAGTKWLTTTAGVEAGETIELVLAVFDLSDGILDTVVLLDNWHWTCDGGPPVTIPG